MSKQLKEKKQKLTREEKKQKRAADIAAMSPEEKAFYDYTNKWHRIGRIWNTIGVLMILAVPIVICLYYNVSPDWAVLGNSAVITLLIINAGSGISEPIIYAPMLGTNGEYLAFITGNLSNLKIPCVVKAHEIAGTKLGTEENELVSTISVAVSSLVTVLIVAFIVLLLTAITPLQGAINDAKYLTPAFGCVVYALFGSLGGKYMVKNPKMAVIPGFALVALTVIIGLATKGKSSIGSLSLMVGIVVCAIFAIIQVLLQRKKAKAAAEKEELAASVDKEGEVEVILEETDSSVKNTGMDNDRNAADDNKDK